MQNSILHMFGPSGVLGATENARHENEGLENAGTENATQSYRAGK